MAGDITRSPALLPVGKVVVTGGLGSLGLLVALWLLERQQCSGMELHLLGKSGRGGPPEILASILEGDDCVTLSRCDVSCHAEAAALLHDRIQANVQSSRHIKRQWNLMYYLPLKQQV